MCDLKERKGKKQPNKEDSIQIKQDRKTEQERKKEKNCKYFATAQANFAVVAVCTKTSPKPHAYIPFHARYNQIFEQKIPK